MSECRGVGHRHVICFECFGSASGDTFRRCRDSSCLGNTEIKKEKL